MKNHRNRTRTMKNQPATKKPTWSCTGYLWMITGGYKRLQRRTDGVSLHTNTQKLHHNIYFIIVAQTIRQHRKNTTKFNVMKISFCFHCYLISDDFWHRHLVPRHNRHTKVMSGMACVRYIGYPPFWSFLSATLSLHQVPSAPLRPPQPPSGPLSPYPP